MNLIFIIFEELNHKLKKLKFFLFQIFFISNIFINVKLIFHILFNHFFLSVSFFPELKIVFVLNEVFY